MRKTDKLYSHNHEDIELNQPYGKQRQSLETLNVPKKVVYSVAAYRKISEEKVKAEMVALTERTCGEMEIGEIKKLKLYKKSEKPDYFVMKIETNNQSIIWLMPIYDCFKFASLTFSFKLQTMNIKANQNDDFLNTCEGEVLKKGEILKKWEPRHLLITQKDGLMSFKDKNLEPTLRIETTEEVWTRFEIIENHRFLVFKVWYSIVKEEFAVPVLQATKWFKAFASLLDR